MNDEMRKIKNAQGLRNLEQTRLAYSHEILASLAENPTLVDALTDDLGISNQELFDKLSGVSKGNISFYDQGLESVRMLSKRRSIGPKTR